MTTNYLGLDIERRPLGGNRWENLCVGTHFVTTKGRRIVEESLCYDLTRDNDVRDFTRYLADHLENTKLITYNGAAHDLPNLIAPLERSVNYQPDGMDVDALRLAQEITANTAHHLKMVAQTVNSEQHCDLHAILSTLTPSPHTLDELVLANLGEPLPRDRGAVRLWEYNRAATLRMAMQHARYTYLLYAHLEEHGWLEVENGARIPIQVLGGKGWQPIASHGDIIASPFHYNAMADLQRRYRDFAPIPPQGMATREHVAAEMRRLNITHKTGY